MRLLPRYVLIELVKVFSVTLTSLTLTMMLVGVVKEAVDQGLGLVHVLRMLPYILPNALVFALPGSMLFAASIVYGRMSGSNEVVAIKSLGISPMQVLWPAFALAFVLSLVCVWLNDIAVSWGFNNVQRVAIQAIDDIAYGMLNTQNSYNSKRFSINVHHVDGRILKQPRLSFTSAGNAPAVTISAQEGELRCDIKRNVLVIACRNGVAFGKNGMTYHFEYEEHEIPLHDASGKVDAHNQPSHVPLREIPAAIEERKQIIERTRQELAANAALALATGDFFEMAQPYWEGQRAGLVADQNLLARFRTEPPRRWSNGFSCLCFVLIGAPMAIRLRNSDVFTSFFACFLPILIVYYPLLIYGVELAKDGKVPSHGVWLGNVILSVWGMWLTRRVIRF